MKDTTEYKLSDVICSFHLQIPYGHILCAEFSFIVIIAYYECDSEINKGLQKADWNGSQNLIANILIY